MTTMDLFILYLVGVMINVMIVSLIQMVERDKLSDYTVRELFFLFLMIVSSWIFVVWNLCRKILHARFWHTRPFKKTHNYDNRDRL